MKDDPNVARSQADQEPTANGVNHSPEPYYIVATSPATSERSRVLKQGDTFAVFDSFGDIKSTGMGEEGIYHGGTRFLSRLLLGLGRHRPLFLSSTVKQANDLLAVDLTNPDVTVGGRVSVPRGTLHLARNKFLWQGACYERLSIKNYQPATVETSLLWRFEADYADIFEVRGTHRAVRGRPLSGSVDSTSAVLAYEGLDGVVRRTRLTFSPQPQVLTQADARFDVSLPPQGEVTIDVTISCEGSGPEPRLLSFDQALAESGADMQSVRADICSLHGTNERFNDWMVRAVADLHLMTTATPLGPYPYAGIPWFSTPFGRDGIITALECLWCNPSLARGVLGFLAATQATEVNPEQDAQPGKILHEARSGEMAALGEIPFGRYYGSVDATPLFVLLAGAYYQRTADRPFLESIWPNVEAAQRWIDDFGDLDGDGLVEYARSTPRGLANQGWKDSHDGIFHADGSLADGPIALCEVQGYVYAARQSAAELARVLGQRERAELLERQARALQERFEGAFWCEELSTYALALDGDKRPCRVRTSNAGQCLFTGIAAPERARRVAQTLLGAGSFSGWGVRTADSSAALYNPMSYHNGSVWPHDNALIAWGLSRYGLQEDAVKITTGLFEASQFLDLHRLPELFCGFAWRAGEGPTLYPVACAPQAWSAAAVFLLVQSCLGLSVSTVHREVRFSYPLLPAFLRELQIHNLRVGSASVDLLLRRHGADVGINVLRREGDVQIYMVK
jgi:glycogen debranching enzyme